MRVCEYIICTEYMVATTWCSYQLATQYHSTVTMYQDSLTSAKLEKGLGTSTTLLIILIFRKHKLQVMIGTMKV